MYLLFLLISVFICCLCVSYMFLALNWCMEEVWDLLDWRKELFKSKEASLHASRVVNLPFCHESSMFAESWTYLSVMSRACLSSREPTFLSQVMNYSRVVNFPFCHDSWTTHESSTFQNFKSHNFSDLSSFLVLGIISSTDVQIEWFKLL